MKTPAPFEASRLKVKRAVRHIQELGALLQTFAELQAVHQISGQMVLGHLGGFPEEVPLALGDAAHNLRAALDLMACDVVRLNEKSAKGVHFPFAGDPDGLEVMMKAKNFDRASGEAQNLLRKLKPYKGGDALLRGLHDLDLMDKHQLIVPVAPRNEFSNMVIETPDGGRITISNTVIVDADRTVKVASGSKFQGRMETSFTFGLDTPHPLPGENVLNTLQTMAEMVLDIIENFAALLLRPSKPAPIGN